MSTQLNTQPAPVPTNCRHCGGPDNVLCAGQCKQARALDKKAENARELGLDYEPAGGTQVSKVWWDGEKLMAKPIPLEDIYQPAPEQDQIRAITQEAMQKIYDLEDRVRRDVYNIPSATPVQEPVAWRFHSAIGWTYRTEPPIGSKYAVQPLYTTPPVQEPFDHKQAANTALRDSMLRSIAIAKHIVSITPPAAQRQWVEVEQIKWEGDKLIAKLKEQNT